MGMVGVMFGVMSCRFIWRVEDLEERGLREKGVT